MPQALTTAEKLERCATHLHNAAFDWQEQARSHTEVERRIGEVEQICIEARAAVRGAS